MLHQEIAHGLHVSDLVILILALLACWTFFHFFAACIVYYGYLQYFPKVISQSALTETRTRWHRGYVDTQGGFYFRFDADFVFVKSWDFFLPFLTRLTGIAKVPYDRMELVSDELIVIKCDKKTIKARPAGLYPQWPEICHKDALASKSLSSPSESNSKTQV